MEALGGANGDGTVFELAKGSSTITTLASFNGRQRLAEPLGGLIMDSSGNLYGTTERGGSQETTAPFSSWPRAAAPSPRWHRSTAATGQIRLAGLIMDSSGNLYGTTEQGGAYGDGTVFELAKGSGTITTLASFNGANGAFPFAGLIMDSSGNLYGTTEGGGANDGAGTRFRAGQGQQHHHHPGVVQRHQR